MTIQSLKGTVAKLLTAGFLAGAVALAVPARANAQEVYFGAPAPRFDRDYDRRAYFERERIEAFRREQFRREEWRRERRFDRYHFDHERRFDR